MYNELVSLPKAERYEGILKVQIERTERLIQVGALISIVTHPEYDLSMKPELLEVYDRYLSYLRTRDDVWFTTAGSLYKYWTENEPDSIHTRNQSGE
ncbi:MAG: hypothetical protein LWX54_08835 [Deltaproteobacteria bacterium]|nr:hypothetical protein [Deltaproteobacteria bacterium]